MTALQDTLTRPLAPPSVPLRKWGPLIAVAAVLLLAVVALAAWGTRGIDPAPPKAEAARNVAQLPARPEDIEAHGDDAKSRLAPDAARARNAAVPFADVRLDISKPFAFRGSDLDRARAVQCLAAAALYEAGDDPAGQEAVVQVVLNRVRHPAFPATICGVVYQGSERTTGCQFTFTCDGSLKRTMPDAMWERARAVARRALDGAVDETVGLATHYHTDWVYPYWSPSLRKLAQVKTHLFFGWPGRWGGPGAFTRSYRGNEALPALPGAVPGGETAESDAQAFAADDGRPKILGLPQPKAELPEGMGKVPLYGTRLRLVGTDGRSFGLLTGADTSAAKLVNAALALCQKPGPCRVDAWSNEDDIPGEYPLPSGADATKVFEFARADGTGQGSLRFDCAAFPNRDPARCLSARLDPGKVLTGVRFKTK